MNTINSAINTAAHAVRKELLRLDYVEGSDEPDEEDKAIAAAAISAFLSALHSETNHIRNNLKGS